MLPTPQESASMLVASINRHLPTSHQSQAEILLAITQHIEADRAAHVRHVAQNATNLIDPITKGTK